MRQIWVPHLKKMSVVEAKGLGIFGWPGFDPADPPLGSNWDIQAKELSAELYRTFGAPALIVTSPKRRCLQTAQPAIDAFVKPLDSKAPIAVSLSCLAQTDSGDRDPTNPKAEKDGLVYYGERSGPADWVRWFGNSREAIWSLEHMGRAGGETIWVFTHRPLVAAARWASKHDLASRWDDGALDDLNPLDESVLPYCIFEEKQGSAWMETPRT